MQNQLDYPSPVLPVGSMHSVTQCLVTDGGTLLNVKSLNRIKGLNTSTGRVSLETGVTLADLHDWLGSQVNFPPLHRCCHRRHL